MDFAWSTFHLLAHQILLRYLTFVSTILTFTMPGHHKIFQASLVIQTVIIAYTQGFFQQSVILCYIKCPCIESHHSKQIHLCSHSIILYLEESLLPLFAVHEELLLICSKSGSFYVCLSLAYFADEVENTGVIYSRHFFMQLLSEFKGYFESINLI